jgi:ABC-type polysaccharide/polyol phosphate export permease
MGSSEGVAERGVLVPPHRAGSDWRRTADLIWATAVFDWRRRYAGSVIGLGWAILEPVLWTAVAYLVFTRILKFGGDIPDYVAMLLLNVMLFWSFRRGVRGAMRSLITKKAIVKSMQVPKVAFGLAGVLTAGLFLPINLAVAFVWILGYGIDPKLSWLLLPVIVAYLALVTIAFGLLLSALYARWRDTEHFWRPLNRVLFLASGVIFPFELIKGELFRTLAAVNPLCPVFVQARQWIIDPQAPSWIEASGSTLSAVLPFATLLVLAAITALVYRPLTRHAAENL